MILVAALAGCASNESPAGSGSPDPSPPSPTQSATVTPSASPTGADGTCEPFGSTEDQESADPLAMSTLTGASMRLGQHECFERFVFELTGTGDAPGWRVGYRDPIAGQGSGDPIELLGDADLEIVVQVWTVSDFEGRPDEWPPFEGPDDLVTTGYDAILQARNLYAFEGSTQIGLGLDRERPFQVSYLEDPHRLVVDVSTS